MFQSKVVRTCLCVTIAASFSCYHIESKSRTAMLCLLSCAWRCGHVCVIRSLSVQLQFREIVICRVSVMRAMFMLKTQFHDLLNMLNVFRAFHALHAISGTVLFCWEKRNINERRKKRRFAIRSQNLILCCLTMLSVYYLVFSVKLHHHQQHPKSYKMKIEYFVFILDTLHRRQRLPIAASI